SPTIARQEVSGDTHTCIVNSQIAQLTRRQEHEQVRHIVELHFSDNGDVSIKGRQVRILANKADPIAGSRWLHSEAGAFIAGLVLRHNRNLSAKLEQPGLGLSDPGAFR